MAVSSKAANASSFAKLAAIELKCDGIIDSAHRLKALLGHIDARPAEDGVFGVLGLSDYDHLVPEHIHLGVLDKVIVKPSREVDMLTRYGRRLSKQGYLPTESDTRRIRVLVKALIAFSALDMLHEACKSYYAAYMASLRTPRGAAQAEADALLQEGLVW